MVEYNTINAKLSNSELNKLKSAVKNKQGTTLRMNARMFNGNNLPHELFLTKRQITKLRNIKHKTIDLLKNHIYSKNEAFRE